MPPLMRASLGGTPACGAHVRGDQPTRSEGRKEALARGALLMLDDLRKGETFAELAAGRASAPGIAAIAELGVGGPGYGGWLTLAPLGNRCTMPRKVTSHSGHARRIRRYWEASPDRLHCIVATDRSRTQCGNGRTTRSAL
jgi:hypothetical protein